MARLLFQLIGTLLLVAWVMHFLPVPDWRRPGDLHRVGRVQGDSRVAGRLAVPGSGRSLIGSSSR
jgi:hypothetical protein